jgi:putative peptidoglycan lipid II flippase
VVFGISAVQSSVLHGYRHFLLPALAPVLYPLGITAGALWLAPSMGARGLAAGAILGAILHLLVKIPGLLHYGFRWQPVLDLKLQAVRRVLILMGPRVLDLGVFHLTLVATTNLASRLDAGSVSALEWGWDAMQIPETIIGTAFGLVAFPTLAALAAAGDIAGLRYTLGQTLRMIIVLTVPATFGLILLGRPLLSIVYQRGAFDAAATDAVFIALQFYALGLTGHACLEVAARAFFAQQDTVTPLIIAAIFGAINIGLAVLLMGPMGHGGLALANALAISAEVVALLVILHRRLGGVEAGEILRTLGQAMVASLVMGIVILGIMQLGAGAIPLLALVAGAGLAGLAAYIGAGLLLRLRALVQLPLALLGRG